MVKNHPRMWRQLLIVANILVLIVVVNQLSARWFFRIDLTEDKRYTIKPQTIRQLEGLQDEVFIEVFLDGDLNPGFKRFQQSVRDVLEEFRIRSNGRVSFAFTDPGAATDAVARRDFLQGLIERGLEPLNLIETKDGQRSEQILVPGALISFAGTEVAVNLVRNRSFQGDRAVDALNQSIETIEYELSSGLDRLVSFEDHRVGWAAGHGESDGPETAGLRQAIRERFALETIDVPSAPGISDIDVLVVVRPTIPWPEADQYKLDQFVMRGGRILFLIDNHAAAMKDIPEEDFYVPPVAHGLSDLLFRYGIRVNDNAIQDAVALPVPVVTGTSGGKSQIAPMDWPFFPLVTAYADHPSTRNLDPSVFRFASSLDTVPAGTVKHVPLVWSSPYARVLTPPIRVQLNDLRNQLKPELFNQGPFLMACLVEGEFASAFRNRFRPEGTGVAPFAERSVKTRIVVMGDADVAYNEINRQTGKPWPTGYDPITRQTLSNRDLLLNTLAYLADDDGLILARSRKVSIRMLDKARIREERSYWQFFNLGIPVLIMTAVVAGAAYWRRKRYSSFK